MAFRTKALCCLIIAAALLPAADLSYPVRHRHARHGADATLTLKSGVLAFSETGKHSREWPLADIQRLELSPDRLRIVSYERRDRVYVLDRLPEGAAAELYAALAPGMDQRFVARIAVPAIDPLWSTAARMLPAANGTLTASSTGIVFESPAASRTWRIADIENVTSEGPFELTLTSLDGDTRIQLKQRLTDDRFNDLWRRVSQTHGLKAYHASIQEKSHE